MMTSQHVLSSTDVGTRTSADVGKLYQEGIVAGVLGAATIAVWFLILDTIQGRPLYTPTVLGTALFKGSHALESPGTLSVSFDMVLVISWVHLLIFTVVGGLASRLLALAEERPNIGFGVVLLFVVFEFGFVATAMIFAQPVLHALDWPAILVGNLFAAMAMILYFRRRHPNLRIEP
jgi:hypothetical protein